MLADWSLCLHQAAHVANANADLVCCARCLRSCSLSRVSPMERQVFSFFIAVYNVGFFAGVRLLTSSLLPLWLCYCGLPRSGLAIDSFAAAWLWCCVRSVVLICSPILMRNSTAALPLCCTVSLSVAQCFFYLFYVFFTRNTRTRATTTVSASLCPPCCRASAEPVPHLRLLC